MNAIRTQQINLTAHESEPAKHSWQADAPVQTAKFVTNDTKLHMQLFQISQHDIYNGCFCCCSITTIIIISFTDGFGNQIGRARISFQRPPSFGIVEQRYGLGQGYVLKYLTCVFLPWQRLKSNTK
jgi:hypothetical protein